MDLTLDKPRLTRWARLLRSYLADHQQVEIRHAAAVSAIAAMLGQPNANTLTARLKAEAGEPAPQPRPAGADPNDESRRLHYVMFVWAEDAEHFMTLAWLTGEEARLLTRILETIQHDSGLICCIQVFDRAEHDAPWHGNAAALVHNELKTALGVWAEIEDEETGEVTGNHLDPLASEPPAPPRAPAGKSVAPARGDLSGFSNAELVKELRRRNCMACVFEPGDVARQLSAHPWVRDGSLDAADDPDGLTRAGAWLFDNESRIEERLIEVGNDVLDSLIAEQDAAPRIPVEGEPILPDAARGLHAEVGVACEAQPRLDQDIYRVITDGDQLVDIQADGPGRWRAVEILGARMRPPAPGTPVRFPADPEAHIAVVDMPARQPYSAHGVFTIVDQYGETHHVERDGDGWTALICTRHLN